MLARIAHQDRNVKPQEMNMSTPSFVIVKDAFQITGRGTAILPENGLSSDYFACTCAVEIERPNGIQEMAKAVVESMRLSETEPREVFTFLLIDKSPDTIAKGSTIRIVEVESCIA